MNHFQPRADYIESKILTAPPHKLHLALIDGALRFGRQAEEALRREAPKEAATPLLRVIEIVEEMLAGVRESQATLNRQIGGFSLFLFRMVAEAKINDDPAKLADALRLLEYERETWQLVCDRLGSDAADGEHQPALPVKPPVTRTDVAPPLRLANMNASSCGLSLEA